jgi:hypothetical protein
MREIRRISKNVELLFAVIAQLGDESRDISVGHGVPEDPEGPEDPGGSLDHVLGFQSSPKRRPHP